MTEWEWFVNDHAARMLRLLWRDQVSVSQRKYDLFAVAVCNKLRWLFKHDWYRFALDMIEEAAEDLPKLEQSTKQTLGRLKHEMAVPPHADNPYLDRAHQLTVFPMSTKEDLENQLGAVSAALQTAWGNRRPPFPSHGEYLRCIVGNPFRPVTFADSWRSETTVSLATGIYAERAFDRLPILADALEEAGCDNVDVLNHCRGPGPHARGCWVVDGVLGKS